MQLSTPDEHSGQQRYFCFDSWDKHPLPADHHMILAQAVPNGICSKCPLACRCHILVPSANDKNSYAKYCTISAIESQLISTQEALAAGQCQPTEEELAAVDGLVQHFGITCQGCKQRPACLAQSVNPDAACLLKQKGQFANLSKLHASQLPTHQVDQLCQSTEKIVHPVPFARPVCLVGWQSDSTPDHGPKQLYLIKAKKDFSVTYLHNEATKFKNADLAIAYYRSIGSVHGDIESNIHNGFLQLFEYGPAGLRKMPKPTRQGSLFDNLPPEDFVQPTLIRIKATAATFGRDETKLISGGFVLVKYNRDQKAITITSCDTPVAWMPPAEFATYAAAERCLSEMLQNEQVIQVSLDGDILGHQSIKRAHSAGFDLYRIRSWDNRHSIVCSSKNWGIWQKYESQEDLTKGWADLMGNAKALRG